MELAHGGGLAQGLHYPTGSQSVVSTEDTMFTTLGLIASLGVAAVRPQPMDHLRLYRDLQGVTGTRISVWLDRTNPYRRGDRARVYVSADRDAYLTVLRIDTDGRVRVLFPQDPWDDNFVTGGRTFEVEDPDGNPSFRIDDAPGEGYVFAIASDNRFDYSSILTDRDHWDYRTIADGQVRGDPYVAVTDLAERIVPQGDYDYDLAQYDVERHYDYPRFVCYDCHTFVPYYAWNPYAQTCVRFRVVIYDDPYYYPYRYYGRRTVFVRPRRAEPRYVFVDNTPGNNYVTRIPNRPRREDEGNGGDQLRPRRGEDVGGRGTIPAPGVPDRRIIRQPDQRPDGQGQDRPDLRRPGRDGNVQPQQQPDVGQPDQRRPDRRDRPDAPVTPATPRTLNPQLRPPQDPPARGEPRPDRPDRQKEQPRRDEPQRQPDRPPERRAEPARQPDRPPERHADPPARRDNGNSGGGRSGSPELRRRHP